MTFSNKTERGFLILLLIVTFLKGATWAAIVPLWQSPDEYTHFSPVQFIAENGRLPGPDEYQMSQELCQSKSILNVHHVAFRPMNRQTFSEQLPNPARTQITELPDYSRRISAKDGCVSVSMHLPPLYYLLGAGVYRLVYNSDFFVRTFAIRLLSVVITTITVLFSWLITREIFPTRRALRFTVGIAVSFHPMFTFLGSVINTDSLLFCLSTILIYICIQIVKYGLTSKRALYAGIITGLGILTKPHIYSVVIVLGVALLVAGWQQRHVWRQWLCMVMIVGSVTIFIGGWGIYRTLQLNDSVFYASPESEIWGTETNYNYDWTGLKFLGWYEQRLQNDLLKSYWGNFGWLDAEMPATIYILIRWGIVLSIIGIVVFITRKTGGLLGQEQNPFLIILLAGVGVVFLLAVFGYVRMKTYGPHQPSQGRYFLNPLAAQMLLLVLGLVELSPRRLRPFTHTAIRVCFIGLNVLALLMVIIPRYYVLNFDTSPTVRGWAALADSGGDVKKGVYVWPQQSGVTDLELWINATDDVETFRIYLTETGSHHLTYISDLITAPSTSFPIKLILPACQQVGQYPLFINVSTVTHPEAYSNISTSVDNNFTPPVGIGYSADSVKDWFNKVSVTQKNSAQVIKTILGRIYQLKPPFFQGKALLFLFGMSLLGIFILLYGAVREAGRGAGIKRWFPISTGFILGLVLVGTGFEIGNEPDWIVAPMSGLEETRSSKVEIVHDLVLELNKTENIDDPHNFVSARWVDIDGAQPVVWMHAPSSVTYRVHVPAGARLEFDLALDPETWNPSYGDGVVFIVSVVGENSDTPIFYQAIDPKHNPDHRGWLPYSVNLSDYAGQTINLRLQTQPLENNDWDWSMWGTPRIITGTE